MAGLDDQVLGKIEPRRLRAPICKGRGRSSAAPMLTARLLSAPSWPIRAERITTGSESPDAVCAPGMARRYRERAASWLAIFYCTYRSGERPLGSRSRLLRARLRCGAGPDATILQCLTGGPLLFPGRPFMFDESCCWTE